MKSTQPIITVNDVSFYYGEVASITNLSFIVKAGDYIGVIGPNGGGKTTLIKLLLGLVEPASGSITVLGQPVKSFTEKHLIGYVPQRITYSVVEFPATVREIVESGRTAHLGLFHRFKASDHKEVEAAMEHADVMHLQHRRLAQLSGGERQRVFIARALASNPRILILDEPTVGVDVVTQDKFFSFLKKLNKEFGITIMFVTHDIDVIAREATTVLCLNHEMVCYGPPSDFVKEEYMGRLYGKARQPLQHNHSH